MKFNSLNYRDQYNKNGYFICRKIFERKFINQLIEEINNSKNTVRYFDKLNNLRRIEKLYNKGNHLNELNKKILDLLEEVFNKDFIIFKDKFNAKPPGGEGFFAHYDGIFHFINPKNEKKKGWYEYGDFFINALVALDECTRENGALELAKYHKGTFDQLLENTKKNGTPALTNEVEKDTTFDLINLDVGDVVIFSNTCPHRSKKNDSSNSRRILYYTYSLAKNGSKYEIYFEDKAKSKNISKVLIEK